MFKNLIGLALLFYPVMAQFPIGTSPTPEQTSWTLASYNVRAFYQQRGIAIDIAQWTQSERIDILCTQEMRQSVANPVADRYPFECMRRTTRVLGPRSIQNFPSSATAPWCSMLLEKIPTLNAARVMRISLSRRHHSHHQHPPEFNRYQGHGHGD